MTAPTLHLGVDLPLAFITESNAILGKKGSGKTTAGIDLIEEVYAAGVPFVSIDPKGDHYGLRASRTAGKPGLPIPVFGGLHGDIPLEPTAGKYIAELVRSKNLSVVLDVSEFTGGERARFLTAFADALYRFDSKAPLHVVLEEAHEYIPQRVMGEDAKMVGVFERLVKLGRWKGIGVTMMSQRSASLNKNVLTQVDNLFVMRTTSPQDRAAVKLWIDTHADARDILDTLPSLQTGEAWLWQPSRGEPIRFRFRERRTYDAGATPVIGEAPRAAATLADVDLGEIESAMQETIERAKADDPTRLRTRIIQLERELERAAAARPEPEVKTIEVPVVTEAHIQRLAALRDEIRELLKPFNHLEQRVTEVVSSITDEIAASAGKVTLVPLPKFATPGTVTRALPEPRTEAAPVPVQVARAPQSEGTGSPVVGKAGRSILTVLAQRGQQTKQQVAMLTGYSSTGGGFNNALGALRSAGYIGQSKDPLDITVDGRAALGDYEEMPTGPALVEFWLAKCSKAERLILDHLVNIYPGADAKESIAAHAGYEPTGGGFNNALGRLRTLTLIHGDRNTGYTADVALGEARG